MAGAVNLPRASSQGHKWGCEGEGRPSGLRGRGPALCSGPPARKHQGPLVLNLTERQGLPPAGLCVTAATFCLGGGAGE